MEACGPAAGTKVPLAGMTGYHILRKMPPRISMYDMVLAKRLGFVVSIRQLVPQRQPASLEVVSMKVGGD